MTTLERKKGKKVVGKEKGNQKLIVPKQGLGTKDFPAPEKKNGKKVVATDTTLIESAPTVTEELTAPEKKKG